MNDLEAVYQKNPMIGRREMSRLTGVTERKCRTWLRNKRNGRVTVKSNENNITEEHYINALIDISRHDMNRLGKITEDEFRLKTNSKDNDFNYEEIYSKAFDRLNDMGFCYPEIIVLDANSKIMIVGDSHGKHTRSKMFSLIKNVVEKENIDYIIHLGHVVDDDNVISYHWWSFGEKLIIVAKPEELATVTKTVKDNNAKCKVVRDTVMVGKFDIKNQEFITDYVKTHIGSIDQHIYNRSTIVNCHRHEISARCTSKYNIAIASAGCLCESHIVRCIKQIDFLNGYQIKQTRPDSYIKYRKAKEMLGFWEQGMIILENQTIVPCRIKLNKDENYETSYLGLIYNETSREEPAKKIFINADIHCDLHNSDALNIQEQFIKEYNPDVFVNLGDSQSNEALNHHKLSNESAPEKSIIEEQAKYTRLLERMSTWAEEKHILFANHEQFMVRFALKFKSLSQLFSIMFNYPAKKYNYKVTGFKDILTISEINFVHGDLLCFGQQGTSGMEKIAKTVGINTLSGHSHMTGIRFGCYSVASSCKLDQGYNEINASRWSNGFAIANVSNSGEVFISNISYDANDTLSIGGKEYKSNGKEFIDYNNYETIIDFNFS